LTAHIRRRLRQEPKAPVGSAWRHPSRTRVRLSVRPFATVSVRGHPRHPHPPARALGPQPIAISATGHRSTRAPLLRFWPLQRSKPCCAVRACHFPHGPASAFFIPPLRVSAYAAFATRIVVHAVRVFATCLPTHARYHPGLHTGPPRRTPRRSFIAGFYAADVPDPPWPSARPCRGQHTRSDAHGVQPFAVLILPAGRSVSPRRSTHLPFPECPPRTVLVEGSAA
jgi:hypothetical protein